MNEIRFDDRVAIVTGAGNGLGRAYAHLLAERGASVVVNDIGRAVDGTGDETDAADRVANEITALGGSAVANRDSVDSEVGAAGIVGTALEAFGRLDIVVNNAGIVRARALHNLTAEDFEAVVAVHLYGTFYVTRAAFPVLRDQGYGRIVSTSSPAGLYGSFGQSNYSAAKMGVVGFVKSVAHEGAKRNVLSNVVSPSAFTRMTEGVVTEGDGGMPPESVAPVVAYLCHEECTLNGAILSAVGGRVGAVYVEETRGIVRANLTIEDVAGNLHEILSRDVTMIPGDIYQTIPWRKRPPPEEI